MKWDYRTTKGRYFSAKEIGTPSCQTSQATGIDRELRSVKLNTRKSDQFTIVPKTDLYAAVTWLPAAERPKRDMCE